MRAAFQAVKVAALSAVTAAFLISLVGCGDNKPVVTSSETGGKPNQPPTPPPPPPPPKDGPPKQ